MQAENAMQDAFVAELHKALQHLYDPGELRKSRLLTLFSLDKHPTPLSALRQNLLNSIQALKPGSHVPDHALEWRLYEVLTFRYVEQISQKPKSSSLFFLALGFVFDFDDLNAVVRAAGEADVMRQAKFLALRAHHELLRLERQMAAPAIAGALLDLSFRKSTHWEKLLSRSGIALSHKWRATAVPHHVARERIITDAPGVSRLRMRNANGSADDSRPPLDPLGTYA